MLFLKECLVVEKVHANLTAKRAATPHDLHFITIFTLCLQT
jgi:hypothetical protein